jgi:APA family basic amino acid/polyamine antiporter
VTGRWSIIAVIALLYSLAMFVGAGLEATLWGLGLALAGLPVRAISRWLNGSSRAAVPQPVAPRE